jgi:tetratricopeptide (TPR) repeat protein
MQNGRKHYLAVIFVLAALGVSIAAHASGMDASALLRAGKFNELQDYYSAVQLKFASRKISGDELRNEFRVFYPIDKDLAPKYDAWVTAFPKSYVARLARGIYYKRVGLDARGERYISETSRSQLDRMDFAFRRAVNDLGTSISMDSKPFLSYFHTMDIGRQYLTNVDSRKVFDGAAALDPKSLGLRIKFMLTLEPRWGGSTKAMRAFLEGSRAVHMPIGDMNQLEAMVYDEEGMEYRADGNLSAAEGAYRKSLSLGPCPCENVRNDLNNVLFESHQFAAAIELLDQYVRDSPNDLWALANRGAAKVALSRSQEAISDFDLAANAGDSFSQYHLGMLYLNGSVGVAPDYAKSVFWLRKAAAQGESEAQSNLAHAEALAAKGGAGR